MAKFTIAYRNDGSQEKQLEFMGRKFIHRMTPLENGVSHALDQDLADQVDAALNCSERVLDLVYEAFDNGCDEDHRDAIARLTRIEEREREQNV